MKQVYACLLGEWVNLNDDENCVMGENMVSPTTWIKEEPCLYSPIKKSVADNYEHLDYINISYKGTDYRINPIFIQIVTK